MITVDQNPTSPHYGRVVVSWTDFVSSGAVYHDSYTDDGGVTWTEGNVQINFTSHECGNGTSPAFNANGELMVAWADCSGGTNQLYEELSPDGGATWPATSDTLISSTNPIESASDNSSADCFLDNGGSAFCCNSFPSLAGDPNSSDAGGTAFFIVWSDVRSTTVGSTTANVAQLIGLTTTDDGSTWGAGSCCGIDFMANDNLGDKFFPWASFAPDGRLTVSYSSREDNATSSNPNGLSYDEHQTEAGSLTSLLNDSYLSYSIDGTLGNPGSLAFIGDYSGNSSLDDNFDTFPVWTDVRNGSPDGRTADACYSDCVTYLSPDNGLSVNQTAGSTFADFYSFNMDPNSGGSGQGYWNVVGIRSGSDGTSVDDDMNLSLNRYFNTTLTFSDKSPPYNDYTVVNGNVGGANTVYFPQVDNYSTAGGPYSIEWDPGHLILYTSIGGSMASSDVARVYDSFLTTGTTYYLGLRPAAGNTSNYSLTLHSATTGIYQGRNNAAADSGDVAPGAPAFISYATGSNTSQFDGVVVLNNNGGSGSYTIYRDTVAPTGTISIDGGAKSTNSTTAHLTLSATNATSGDPVSGMAFSINGGAYGAFRAYATSATVTLPAGDGAKTVSVKYRNRAGAVSSPVNGSIYLVTSAPTITAVTPHGGATSGGNTVTITGTHLAPGSTVKFGATASATVSFVTASKLTAVAPAGSAGTVSVLVTTPAGTSAATNNDLYAYGAPTVTKVSPNGGPTAGGGTVTITGTGFVPGALVEFGSGIYASNVTYKSATTLTATAPAHTSAAVVGVYVRTGAGTSPATSADLYTYS